MKNLESNLWKYTVFLITQKRAYVAVTAAFYLSIPTVNAWWVGIILLASSIAGIVFEMPSGYLSDKMGHRNALILSKILLTLSTLCFVFATNIPLLIAGSILWSAGFAFHSGTGTAFMHDTLRALGRDKEFTEIMGKSRSVGFAVPVLLSILLPFLVEISWQALFLAVLFFDILGLVFSFLLVSPPIPEKHIEELGITNFMGILKKGWDMQFFRYAFFFGILGGVSMGVGNFRAPYQIELGISVIWLGVLFGIGRILASLFLFYNGKIEKTFSSQKAFLFFNIAIFLVPVFLLGLFPSPWIVAPLFILINAFQHGLSEMKRGQMLDVLDSSPFKATLLSVKEQISSLFAGAAGICIGSIAQSFSYPVAFLCIALATLLCILPPLLLIIKTPKSATI